jgi:hypothetical protein
MSAQAPRALDASHRQRHPPRLSSADLHAVGKHEKVVAVADDLDRWSHDETLERNSARPDNPASLDMV